MSNRDESGYLLDANGNRVIATPVPLAPRAAPPIRIDPDGAVYVDRGGEPVRVASIAPGESITVEGVMITRGDDNRVSWIVGEM